MSIPLGCKIHSAVALDDDLAKRLGIGNSTGLGMAPFLLNHPRLLNNWIAAREQAIAQVCSIESISESAWQQVRSLLSQQRDELKHWPASHPIIQARLPELAADLEQCLSWMDQASPSWQALLDYTDQRCGLEAQELVASLILEPYPEIDHLAAQMSADEVNLPAIQGRMKCQIMASHIESRYQWALDKDWSQPASQSHLWYVSARSLSLVWRIDRMSRLKTTSSRWRGSRHRAGYADLQGYLDRSLAEFLSRTPASGAVSRLQWLMDAPYGEIYDNTTGDGLMPIDLLRCKLSIFWRGAF